MRERRLTLSALLATALALAMAPVAHGITVTPIGKSDYVAVWTPAESASLHADLFPSTRAWGSQVCRVLRVTPAKAACTANYALKAHNKLKLEWFFYNARLNGACAIAIFDYGRHPIRKRWKVRTADDFDTGIAIVWIKPGRHDFVQRSDHDDYPLTVYC